MPAELLHKELTFGILGCAQRVHARLGPGFPERVYYRALAHEFRKTGLEFVFKAQFRVQYDGADCGLFETDFFVENKVILEMKAAMALCSQNAAQALAYLKASGIQVGLLINFGETQLRVKRFVN